MAASSLIQCKVEVFPHERHPTLKVPPSLAVARVEPSFTSSDLFTPFCAPRTTLPSIAKFVRPSYGKDNTWGQLTCSYGGVGLAADNFRKTNQGSVSRSHKHYGTGCVTYHTVQPYVQLLLTCDCNKQMKTLNDTLPVTVDSEPVQTTEVAVTSTGRTDANKVTVAPTTVHALESLYTQLYGVSTYKKDFANAKQPSMLTLDSTVSPCCTASESNITCSCRANLAESNHESNKPGEYPCVNEDKECEEESDSENSMESDESMLSHDVVHLPDHIPISHLCHLPVHFRRITTKHTRNKCTTIPCNVPYYLYYKHCLLPSSITTLPANCFSESTWKSSQHHHRSFNATTTTTDGLSHETTSTAANLPSTTCHHGNARPLIQNGIGLPELSKRVPHGHLKPLVHRHKAVQQLGLKFRSQAHARFCSVYPNQVPDFRRTEKSSRRHTFYGHHATVFRG